MCLPTPGMLFDNISGHRQYLYLDIVLHENVYGLSSKWDPVTFVTI